MGCGKSKPHDISSGKSLFKSRRAAKSLRTSLTRNTNSNSNSNNANANPTTGNMAAAADAETEQNYGKGKAPAVEETAAAATVVYDSIPDKSPALAETGNDPVQDQEQPPLVIEESPAVSFSKIEESPAVSFSKVEVEESPVSSMGSNTKPEEESPAYTVDLDATKSGESPVFALISDTELEEPKDQSPPVENDHVTKPEAESPVYTVVSDTNSEESPVHTLVSDTNPEETFVMPNWVDEAMDVVTTEPNPETEKPSAEDDHVNADITSDDHDHVISTSNESPVHDFILASDTTPEGSPITGAGEEGDTAHEFDDAQTKIPAMNEEEKEEETNVVKDDEQEPTTEVKEMKSDDSFEKEIKEKTVVEHGGNGNDGES